MDKVVQFPAIAIVAGKPNVATFNQLERATREWEMRAARGECGWICAGCCQSFPDGMPDQCCYDDQSCTDILARDKAEAMK